MIWNTEADWKTMKYVQLRRKPSFCKLSIYLRENPDIFQIDSWMKQNPSAVAKLIRRLQFGSGYTIHRSPIVRLSQEIFVSLPKSILENWKYKRWNFQKLFSDSRKLFAATKKIFKKTHPPFFVIQKDDTKNEMNSVNLLLLQ